MDYCHSQLIPYPWHRSYFTFSFETSSRDYYLYDEYPYQNDEDYGVTDVDAGNMTEEELARYIEMLEADIHRQKDDEMKRQKEDDEMKRQKEEEERKRQIEELEQEIAADRESLKEAIADNNVIECGESGESGKKTEEGYLMQYFKLFPTWLQDFFLLTGNGANSVMVVFFLSKLCKNHPRTQGIWHLLVMQFDITKYFPDVF